MARRNNGASPNGLFFISLNVNAAKVIKKVKSEE
jgi:hypothetical protein